MSTITGRVVNESNTGIAGLRVVAFQVNLGVEQQEGAPVVTTGTGDFSIPVEAVAMFTSYKIRIYRGAKLKLYESSNHIITSGNSWAIGNITFHSQYVSGWLVRDRTTGAALMLSDNNKIEYHIDNERSWTLLADAIRNAQSEVHMQQFHFLAGKLIFDFNGSNNPMSPPAGAPTPGTRLEEILLQANTIRHLDVKMNIRDVTLLGISITSDAFISATMLLPLFLDVGLARATTRLKGLSGIEIGKFTGVFLILTLGPVVAVALSALPGSLSAVSTARLIKDYFSPHENAHLKAREFNCDFFNPLHAKYTIIDNKAVYITASPFYNGYFGTQNHYIQDYRYGNSTVGAPVHDVSGRIEGPALGPLRETYNRYWNKNGPADTFGSPVVTAQSGTDTATVQVIRTVQKDAFADLPDGETGILEAYKRAINEATDFIYLENQYFTEPELYDMLVEKILATPALQLIVVVNMNMDIPGYNNMQQNLTRALKTALRGKESQFGFFTVWSQEKPANQHQLLNNYVHSKIAVIDDKWATIGSANLDEFSMQNDGGHEVNLAILNGVDGTAASTLPATLRNKLWNEHLFGRDQDNTTTITRPATGGWLSLWKNKATEKLNSIKTPSSAVPASRILEWTDKSDAKDYLKALGVENFDAALLKVMDKVEKLYDFQEGQWVDNGFCNTIKDFNRP